MVIVQDLLERLIGIPLNVSFLFTGLELNRYSFQLPFMEKTKVNGAITSSRISGDFPAFRSKGLHKAKNENVIEPLQSLVTVSMLVLGD
jgi:hypothetical protein